jgi:hypothetical protein
VVCVMNKGAALPAARECCQRGCPRALERHMPAHLKRLNLTHGNGYCQGMVPHSLFLTSHYALLVPAHCCDCGGEFRMCCKKGGASLVGC